jgi:hypothetical protein
MKTPHQKQTAKPNATPAGKTQRTTSPPNVKNDQTAKNKKHCKETLPTRRADNYLPAPQTACTATNQNKAATTS